MSIFNRFFDNRLNRLSKNRFFFRFSKIRFRIIDHPKIEKSILNSITPLSHYHCKSQGCMVQIDICAQGLFYTKFNFEQLSFEPFFEKIRIFGSISPKWNVICSFNNKYNNHDHINLSRTLVPLGG